MTAFTIKLNDDTFRKLTEAAQGAGVTPERMAEIVIKAWILADDDLPDSPGFGEPARAWAGEAEAGGGCDPLTTPADNEGPFVDLDDVTWLAVGDPHEDNAANYDLNEAGRPWSEVRPEFMALIDKTFGKPE